MVAKIKGGFFAEKEEGQFEREGGFFAGGFLCKRMRGFL
jgi:hypothetical protein